MHSRVEELREYGRKLRSDTENRGLLPNIDAVVRRALEPKIGLVLKKEFPGHGACGGKITAIDQDDLQTWMYRV